MLIQLKNAQAILEFNKEKEMEYLHNLKHEDESYIDTAKPLNQEEENKENIESKLSEISKNLKEDLKSMDIKLYEETMKKIKLLYEKIKSPSFNDQEEKQEFLNQILLELNDMCFYFSMSDENTKFSYEILNMKKICLKEMIMFEKEKRDPDNEKSLVLINALLKLYQMKNEYQNEKINEEIIFLLKERGIFLFFFSYLF